MRKLLTFVAILGLVLTLTLSLGAVPGTLSAGQGRGFSAATLDPDVAEALVGQGKPIRSPFPNSANQGKKFNPDANLIGQLTTAATQNVLVLFVDFATLPPGGPAAHSSLSYFDDLLFGTVYNPPAYAGTGAPTNRTLYNFYQEASYGKVTVKTNNLPSTMGWAHLSHPYDYYIKADGIHDNGFGPYPKNAQGLVVDTLKLVDPYIDFSKYAINGVIPNLFVVVAGTGAEWSGAPNLMWSHSWSLDDGTGLTGGYTVDGVKVNDYAMMPEVGGDLTGFTGVVSGPFPPTVGVYAHEYGHVLGLPDQYDYGYESEGTGNFSLMAGGSWNRFPNKRMFSGNSPSELDAWSKYRLGFVNPTLITTAQSVVLTPAETTKSIYKMVVPNSGGKEYFLFENRQQTGFDEGLSRFGAHGLAVYHVDDAVLTHNYGRPNEAQNWKEFRSEGWQKAWTGETHYAISLLQADDLWHLEHGANRGDAGDLYPGRGNVTSLSSYTHPNTSSYYFWAGSEPKFGYSGVTVENITEASGSISATFSFVPWTPAGK